MPDPSAGGPVREHGEEAAERAADPVRALVTDILSHEGHHAVDHCLADIFDTARAILVILDRQRAAA